MSSVIKKVNELVFGKAKDPNDPSVHHGLSLVAFLAWVGLGADGLSSACYGPEATFKALGEYRHLAPLPGPRHHDDGVDPLGGLCVDDRRVPVGRRRLYRRLLHAGALQPA